MVFISSDLVRQKLCVDFASVKAACPKGIYVAPIPDDSLHWAGVLFVRKGPYANAILRFNVAFPDNYPARPPVLTFQSDVFHPLVTPLTTYTYSTRESGTDTVSAADEQRLPPGGLSLRHGFPEWFPAGGSSGVPVQASPTALPDDREANVGDASVAAITTSSSEDAVSYQQPLAPQAPLSPAASASASAASQPPHIVEVLQYLRVVFDTESVLDTVPLEAAANQGAWHAWNSHRLKPSRARPTLGARLSPSSRPSNSDRAETAGSGERSPPLFQQPGGARRPGEWNWQGVWEDRVRKSIQASISDPVLFGGEGGEMIGFLNLDSETLDEVSPLRRQTTASVASS